MSTSFVSCAAPQFLIPNGGYSTVPQLLRRLQGYEPIGGLVVSWVMFGSSGHKTKPKGGVLQVNCRSPAPMMAQ